MVRRQPLSRTHRAGRDVLSLDLGQATRTAAACFRKARTQKSGTTVKSRQGGGGNKRGGGQTPLSKPRSGFEKGRRKRDPDMRRKNDTDMRRKRDTDMRRKRDADMRRTTINPHTGRNAHRSVVGRKPTRVSVSATTAVLTLRSSGVPQARDGVRFTSTSQGLKSGNAQRERSGK